MEAAGKHDRERDLEDGDSPGVPVAGVRLQEDQNLGPSASPSVDQIVLEVLPGLRTNEKSRSKSLEEEWEKPGVQAAGAPVGGFQPVMVWSHRVS